MAIQTTWDNDECTIIRVDILGEWTWSDLHEALTQAVVLLDEQACTQADLIVDVSRVTKIPALALPNVRSLAQRRDPRMSTTVLVGMSDVMRTLLNAFLQVYNAVGRKEHYFLVKTVEEARAQIAKKSERTLTA